MADGWLVLGNSLNRNNAITNKYLINLDTRADRLAEFNENFPLGSYVRFSAVEGRNIASLAKYNKVYSNLLIKSAFKGYDKSRTWGFFGCSLSHYEAWKSIVQNPDYAEMDLFLIMEDDCMFSERIGKEWTKIEKYLQCLEFSVVFLGGRFTKDFFPATIKEWEDLGEGFFKRPNNISNIDKGGGMDWDRTAHAYVLTKSC
ncbi:MAG: GR25 family glycosyltransferase involved in LPS biosynthesis [Parasphingorhabdus sp.]